MRVIFLGTNGWYNTNVGNTICVLIEGEDFYLIFDAGDGIYKLDRYIKDNKPIYLFLSHLHLDHITGLHTFDKFNFPQGITICGQKGTKELLDSVIRPPYSASLNKLRYKITFFELKEGRHDLGFFVQTLSLVHSVSSFGYRVEVDGKIISYCCDTGPCENALHLTKGADLFIAECSLKSGQDSKVWPHLNPQMAAEIAKKAGAKKLVLTHFNAHLFPLLEDRIKAQEDAKEIFANSSYSTDDLEINL